MAKPNPLSSSVQADFSAVEPDFFLAAEPSALLSQVPPDLEIGAEVLGWLTRAIREARNQGLSRARIVDRMNAALPGLERPITERQLNAWTASSKEFHDMPARVLLAFCWACMTDMPLRALSAAGGYGLVDAKENAARELGETLIQQDALRRRRRALEQQLNTTAAISGPTTRSQK